MSNPATDVGTEGTNFLRTRYGYDQPGRRDRVEDSTGTITRTVYDGLGRVVSTWTGTNDTPTAGLWSPTNNDGTSNMVQTNSREYDHGGVGNSNVTREAAFAAYATEHETLYEYDFLDGAVGGKGSGIGGRTGRKTGASGFRIESGSIRGRGSCESWRASGCEVAENRCGG